MSKLFTDMDYFYLNVRIFLVSFDVCLKSKRRLILTGNYNISFTNTIFLPDYVFNMQNRLLNLSCFRLSSNKKGTAARIKLSRQFFTSLNILTKLLHLEVFLGPNLDKIYRSLTIHTRVQHHLLRVSSICSLKRFIPCPIKNNLTSKPFFFVLFTNKIEILQLCCSLYKIPKSGHVFSHMDMQKCIFFFCLQKFKHKASN